MVTSLLCLLLWNNLYYLIYLGSSVLGEARHKLETEVLYLHLYFKKGDKILILREKKIDSTKIALKYTTLAHKNYFDLKAL